MLYCEVPEGKNFKSFVQMGKILWLNEFLDFFISQQFVIFLPRSLFFLIFYLKTTLIPGHTIGPTNVPIFGGVPWGGLHLDLFRLTITVITVARREFGKCT